MTTLIFLIFGLLFIFLEFYLPGAILGTIGGVFLVLSVIDMAVSTNSALITLLYLIVLLALVTLLIRYILRTIPRTKQEYSIYLHKDQEGYRASTYDPTVIGKTGIVLSDLKPGGYITIEGVKHQAISQSGYIPQGDPVEVIGGKEESLIVRSPHKEGSP